MPWRRAAKTEASQHGEGVWGSVMNQNGGYKRGLQVTISMQTQQPWVFGSPSWARWVMPGQGEPSWVYHWALGQVSGAGGGGGAAAGAVAGGFGDGGFGNAGTETRRPTARQSPAPADSPWEPLWTAACPCRWGMGGVGMGNQTAVDRVGGLRPFSHTATHKASTRATWNDIISFTQAALRYENSANVDSSAVAACVHLAYVFVQLWPPPHTRL